MVHNVEFSCSHISFVWLHGLNSLQWWLLTCPDLTNVVWFKNNIDRHEYPKQLQAHPAKKSEIPDTRNTRWFWKKIGYGLGIAKNYRVGYRVPVRHCLLLTSWILAAIWFWRVSQEKMNQKRKSLMGQQVFFFFNVDICRSIDDFVNRVETMVLTNVLLCCQVVCLIPKVGSTADSNMVRPKRRNGHQKWDGSMITSMITSDMSPNHKFTFSRLLYISQTKNDLHTRCSHLLFVLF